MADRIVSKAECGVTRRVKDIEHVETEGMEGRAITKVFFQPKANLQTGLAQITAISQTAVRQLPQGTTPPLIIVYSASSVPIMQVGISSSKLPEQALNDLAVNFVRTQMVTVQGAAVPYPYRGETRRLSVDVSSQETHDHRLPPAPHVHPPRPRKIIHPSHQ